MSESEYVSLEPNVDGILQSQVMPGLWLAVTALLSGDMSTVMTVLQAGLNSLDIKNLSKNDRSSSN